MDGLLGAKELYEVYLKAKNTLQIGTSIYESGETIAKFDKIQIANFNEISQVFKAHGGKSDQTRIIWENIKEVQINFIQGVFSPLQFGLLCNSKIVYKDEKKVYIPKTEKLETDENNKVQLQNKNINNIYCYDSNTYEKIIPESINKKEGIIIFQKPFYNVYIDYTYEYDDKVTKCFIGENNFQDYLQLEGKTRVKNDLTGQIQTGLIIIPRLKLMSNMQMRLGKNANPINANFQAIAIPDKGDKKIMEIIFLNDDIDADI